MIIPTTVFTCYTRTGSSGSYINAKAILYEYHVKKNSRRFIKNLLIQFLLISVPFNKWRMPLLYIGIAQLRKNISYQESGFRNKN